MAEKLSTMKAPLKWITPSNMPAKKQGSRKAPRPSRKNVVITPHKGGRTARFEARLTPAEKQAILKVIRASGLSSADWLVQVSGTANKA